MLPVALLAQLIARTAWRRSLSDEGTAGILGTPRPMVLDWLHERLLLILLDHVALTGAQGPLGHADCGTVSIGSEVFRI